MQHGDGIFGGRANCQGVVALAHQQLDHLEFAIGDPGVKSFEIRRVRRAHIQFQIVGAHAQSGDPGF